MDLETLLTLTALGAIVAATIALRYCPCPDPACVRVHATHTAQQRDARDLAWHRVNHVAFKSPACRYCRDES